MIGVMQHLYSFLRFRTYKWPLQIYRNSPIDAASFGYYTYSTDFTIVKVYGFNQMAQRFIMLQKSYNIWMKSFLISG